MEPELMRNVIGTPQGGVISPLLTFIVGIFPESERSIELKNLF